MLYEDSQETDSALDDEKKWVWSQIIPIMNLYYEKPSTTKGLRYPQTEGVHKRCFVVKRNLCVS